MSLSRLLGRPRGDTRFTDSASTEFGENKAQDSGHVDLGDLFLGDEGLEVIVKHLVERPPKQVLSLSFRGNQLRERGAMSLFVLVAASVPKGSSTGLPRVNVVKSVCKKVR